MPEEERTGEATKRLLDALVRFRRLRGIPYRGKHPQGHECRHSDMMILYALKQLESNFPEGVSIKELSRCLNLKSPTVTPAAYHLEKMELVERSTDDRDRRVNRIRLTEGGRRLLLAQRRRLAAHIHELVLHLGAEKSLMLAELLDEVIRYEFGQMQPKNNNTSGHHPGGL